MKDRELGIIGNFSFFDFPVEIKGVLVKYLERLKPILNTCYV